MRRVALFVDGDNISGQFAAELLARAGQFGRVDIARVYIGANIPGEWAASEGYRMIVAGPGKNGADIMLALDAFELFIDTGYDVAVIVSSDQDFRHLAFRLRERGVQVIGVGDEGKCTAALRKSCSTFEHLPIERSSLAAVLDLPAQLDTDDREFAIRVKGVIAEHSRNGRGMKVTELSNVMKERFDLNISQTKSKSWPRYIKSKPELFAIDTTDFGDYVRFIPKGFCAS